MLKVYRIKMKLTSKKKMASKGEGIRESVAYFEELVTYGYLFCMLGIFPLHYVEGYSKIGNVKYEFFRNTSLAFIGISLIFAVIKVVLQKIRVQEERKAEQILFRDRFSFLDKAVLSYALCVIISYLLSPYKEFAFKGAAGWEMGFVAQMIFVFLYFIISRNANYGYFTLGIHLTASFITYILGILHRFEVDPLGMYEGLNLNQKVEFLSTIGQATWFSSYVCTGVAVGIVVFYISNAKWIRRLTGIYSIVGFGILVTQNSDSAFIAIAGMLLVLGYFSLQDKKRWGRFWEIVSLMWGTFAGIGLLQRIFSDRAIPLDSLSIFFSQSYVIWIFLVISLGMLYFCKKQENEKFLCITAKVYKGMLGIVVIGIFAMIIFIYLNTKGYLLEWFGYQSTHNYLLFNEQWGSHRGSTWMNVWKGIKEMSFLQLLFGVGPDSLSPYIYSIPEVSEALQNLWGNVKLTNAHNEYLNSFVCYGMVGLISWLTVLAGGVRYFYGKAKGKGYMIAFALCIAGYACHNIFCYQQVCCTPFLFIALGIGESLTKSENFNTIK